MSLFSNKISRRVVVFCCCLLVCGIGFINGFDAQKARASVVCQEGYFLASYHCGDCVDGPDWCQSCYGGTVSTDGMSCETCLPGYYLDRWGFCLACPEHATCVGGKKHFICDEGCEYVLQLHEIEECMQAREDAKLNWLGMTKGVFWLLVCILAALVCLTKLIASANAVKK